MTPVFPLEGIIAFINLVNGGKIIETHASPVEAIANTNRLLPDQAIDVPVELLVRSVTNDELACFCREQLANYKVPKAIFIRDELPMLPIGKLDRRALKKRSAQQA